MGLSTTRKEPLISRGPQEETEEELRALTDFDPVRGCQDIGTGVFGSTLALVLVGLYGIYKNGVLANGGPPTLDNFLWLPEACHFQQVNRDFWDLLLIAWVTFQAMVVWEQLKSWRQRSFILLLSLVGLLGVGAVARGSQLFLAGPTQLFLGFELTRMEVPLLLMSVAYGVLWLLLIRRFNPARSRLRWGQAYKTGIWRWFAGLLAFSAVLAVTFVHPLYQEEFYDNWRIACALFYSLYTILGLPYAVLTNYFYPPTFSDDTKDPGFILLLLLRTLVMRPRKLMIVLRNRRSLTLLRDLLVKLFFLPVMICFFFGNCGNMFAQIPTQQNPFPSGGAKAILDRFYVLVYSSLFMMDVILSLIGYLCATRWLGNKSVSVEPTMFGWVVALVCYPPFNQVLNIYLPYGDSRGMAPLLDFARWFQAPTGAWLNDAFDSTLKILALIFFSIYVWATTAFGLRFSNLTHRGILTQGPYAHIRHPAYICKNSAWWCESVRNFGTPWQFLFLAGCNLIYFLRAYTEERHLRQDPAYRLYCKKVRWMFIPGVW